MVIIMVNLGNVFILGDSYSTFNGFIPTEYHTYYPNEDLDVKDVKDTWWQQLLDETNSRLVRNSSYSGTTVCKTGYGPRDCSDICFIGRIEKLINNGFFKENFVDTLFVFGGTNDNWVPSPIGELKFSDWEREELFSFAPAVCYLLNKLKNELPETRIICILNTELKLQITEGFKAACEHFGAEYIALKDITKQNGHPNKMGMCEIKEQILGYLEKN